MQLRTGYFVQFEYFDLFPRCAGILARARALEHELERSIEQHILGNEKYHAPSYLRHSKERYLQEFQTVSISQSPRLFSNLLHLLLRLPLWRLYPRTSPSARQ